MAFRLSTELRVRLPETDAMGIVFHGNFFTYLDVGRVDYLRNLGLGAGNRPIKDFDNVVARAACDFKSPARFEDPLVVKVRIAEIGRSSFRFEFLIEHKQEARAVATGESVHVAIDPATFKAIPVPESFRKVVRAFEGKPLKERKV
jgi:acyl-CoA thioester hydrolase